MVGNQERNHLRNQKKLALKLDFEYILVNFRILNISETFLVILTHCATTCLGFWISMSLQFCLEKPKNF